MNRKIYVASSWRNHYHPEVVRVLRDQGHSVYDFRHPKDGEDGFHWAEIDADWRDWTPEAYREALDHPIAQREFYREFTAMCWADTGVLVLPCGRSAHLEAGYFIGALKNLYVYMPERQEPELMHLMANGICLTIGELVAIMSGDALEV